jgi:hypothetical protein
MLIRAQDFQSHAKMTLERQVDWHSSGRQLTDLFRRKEHWLRLSQSDWPKQAAALRAENGLWPDYGGPVTWRLDGSEGPLRMRCAALD